MTPPGRRLEIRPAPLTAEAFRPFGDVFDAGAAAGRLERAARIENLRPGAEPALVLARSAAAVLPLTVTRMERHPASSQAFIPLRRARAVIAVAPDDGSGAPDLGAVRAFLSGRQGFSYGAGVWHLPLASLGGPRPFAALFHVDGTADDTHWAEVAPFAILG